MIHREITRSTPRYKGRGSWTSIGFRAVLTLALIVLAAVLIDSYEQEAEGEKVGSELTAIARLKSMQLAEWYQDKLTDVERHANNHLFVDLIDQWNGSATGEAKERLVQQLRALKIEHGFLHILVSSNDDVWLSTNQDSFDSCCVTSPLIATEGLAGSRARGSAIYFCRSREHEHLDFIASIPQLRDGPRHALMTSFDPRTSVYPIVESWPVPRNSAECMLVTRVRGSVNVLGPLRFKIKEHQGRTVPVSDTNSVMTKAGLGGTGLVNALDYRGVEVLAYIEAVPGTNWFIIAKIDKSEIIDMSRSRSILLISVIALSILFIGSTISLFLTRRQAQLLDQMLSLQGRLDIEEAETRALVFRNEQQYRTMFEENNTIKLIIAKKGRRILDANIAAERFYGWSRHELKTMSMTEISTWSQLEYERITHNLYDGNKHRFEVQHKIADGSIRDIEIYASRLDFQGEVCVLGALFDITDAKQKEKWIQILGRSIDQIPVSVTITNVHGEIEYVNPAFTKISGYAASEVIGKKPRMLKSGLQNVNFYKNMMETVLRGEDWIGELQNKRKNGELYWEFGIITPMRDETQNITHLIAMKTDISETKTLVNELLHSKQKAEESDRLKSTFLANMSHEIRTPMNAIIGFGELLTSSSLTSEEMAEYISIIQMRSLDLLAIIDDILDASLMESGQLKLVPEVVDLGELFLDIVASANAMLRAAGKEGVSFRAGGTACRVGQQVWIDPYRVRQIMNNFISNAIKFTLTGSITVGCSCTEDMIGMFVSDTGIGIKTEDFPYIFNRFRQVDESSSRHYGGAGLGLAIASGMAKIMGGSIEL
ncbi:MAG: PAS domain S-box protein, partial [Bacteroidota bacterium]